MSFINVSIEELAFTSTSNFRVSTGYKGVYTSVYRRILDNSEIHPLFPELTVDEYLKKSETDEDSSKKNLGQFFRPSKEIESIEEAYSVAAGLIKDVSNVNLLNPHTLPHYTITVNRKDTTRTNKKPIIGKIDKSMIYIDKEVTKDSIEKLRNYDYVTIQSTSNQLLEFPRRPVRIKTDKAMINVYSIPVFQGSMYLSIQELEDMGYTISEIQSLSRKPNYEYDERKYKISDLSLKLKPKLGSVSSILEARKSIASIKDYYDYRMNLGDIFLDDYMVELHKESTEAVKNIEKILEIIDHLNDENI